MSLESIEEHRDLVAGLEYEEYHDCMSYEDRERADDTEPGEKTRPAWLVERHAAGHGLPAPGDKEAA